MEEPVSKLVSAWVTAAKELGIRIVAPFEFESEAGSFRCVAHLPDFAGPHGIIIIAGIPPSFETDKNLEDAARRAGYYLSIVNTDVYNSFDREIVTYHLQSRWLEEAPLRGAFS